MSLLAHYLWQWLRQAARILHRLWLEITGAVFLGLALLGTVSVWKEWNAYPEASDLWEPVAALTFVVMMAGFGIYSFLKAGRLR
jgi:hypothetical protein